MKNYFKNSGFYGICTLILLSTMSMISRTTSCSKKTIIEQPTVIINATQDGHLTAFIKNDKRHINTLFSLQVKDKPSLESIILLENSNILIGEKYFIFSSRNTGKQVVFKLKEAEIKEELGKTAIVFEGFGLIKRVNSKDYRKVNLSNKSLFPPINEYSCKCEENGSKSSCESGGKGATECSVGVEEVGVTASCQVSCGGDYHACCND
jgi:hypothetical protein